MSGIELASLVLGAFPVLIYVLDKYREGAEVLVHWWQIRRAFLKCRQDLEYYRIIYEENIQRLLLPVVVDSDELDTLMKDPAGKGWEDKELETRLKSRLPKSHHLFLDIIHSMNELMESIKKEFGVQSATFQTRLAQVSCLFVTCLYQKFLLNPAKNRNSVKTQRAGRELLDFSNIKFQAKRIRFSLKKSSREELFTQLKEANDRMRSLLESSEQLAVAKKNRITPSSIMSQQLNEFWRHAKCLHEVLSKAWQCNCPNHQTNLQLQHRTSAKAEFAVLFELRNAKGQHHWRHTKISMIKHELAGFPVGDDVCDGFRAPKRPKRCQVRNTNNQGHLLHQGNSIQTQTKRISDLCSTLSVHCNDCFGFLDEDDHRFEICPGSKLSMKSSCSATTLAKALQDPKALTRRKRYSLALVLASSYLQLSSTPWLDPSLAKDNIIFLEDRIRSGSLMSGHPYVRGDTSTVSVTPTDGLPNLGIRLLELCFGTPIENCEFRRQFPAGDVGSASLFDRAAAREWVQVAGEEAGPDFAGAIEWCLRAPNAQDEEWRRDLWAHVIVPLEACHKHMSLKSPGPS